MIAKSLLAEIGHEYGNTRKILERVPVEKFAWQPHPKSMTLEKLVTHLAMLPQFITSTITKDELDFSKGAYPPEKFDSTEQMIASFDGHVAKAKEVLTNTQDEEFGKPYIVRNGEHIIFTLPKSVIIRSFAISHVIHHRAQLQVYLRMLNVPVPGFYGPSADEI
ncbi:MAG TPA: DinB family protein [Chitinophagaceae bacterium]|nr:DinB family protein [Chitinophagaceae bacterium]